MAYNPKTAMEKIYNFKKMWSDAAAAGDEVKKNDAATKAQEFYKQLRENNYGDVAQKLYDSDLAQSRKYIDNYYAMSGKNAIRPYFYGKAGQYGMTNDDIDKMLSFNETTGEVSFNGKNVGKPAAISSDGVSYWDSGDLDNVWNDYVSANGVTKPLSTTAKQGTEDLMGMNKQLFDATMKDHDNINSTNPLDSDVGRAIMQKYGLAGYMGRNNALATGASTNGGNVDSYSAANAMRQQAALNSMGAEAALNAYNSQVQNAGTRLDQARATLQQLGVNINDAVANNETMLNGEVDRSEKLAQGAFDREQMRLNNEVERNETVLNGKSNRAEQRANIEGYVPAEYTYEDNPYLDSNGNVINPDQYDFADMIAGQQNLLARTTDEGEKASIRQNIEWLRQAGRQKVLMPQYSQYASNWSQTQPMGTTKQQTEDARQFDEGLKNSENVARMGYDHELKKMELQHNYSMEEANNNSRNNIAENSAAIDDQIRLIGSQTSGTSGSSGSSGKSGSSSGGKDKTSSETMSDEELQNVVDQLNKQSKSLGGTAITVTTGGNYKVTNGFNEFVANRILSADDLTREQKEYLLTELNVRTGAIEDILSNTNNYKR